MKKLKEIGKALSKGELKKIHGGDVTAGEGPCRDAYPAQPVDCYCQNDSQCAEGLYCKTGGGGPWFEGKCAKKPELSDI